MKARGVASLLYGSWFSVCAPCRRNADPVTGQLSSARSLSPTARTPEMSRNGEILLDDECRVRDNLEDEIWGEMPESVPPSQELGKSKEKKRVATKARPSFCGNEFPSSHLPHVFVNEGGPV